jgi:hypothetical protein
MRCACCKAETELYDHSAGVCFDCAVRERLTQEVLETTARKGEAFRQFEAIMLHIPSGLPHRDGVQQIKNASNELSIARKEMVRAYERLGNYLDNRIVPEDLKAIRLKSAAVAADATPKVPSATMSQSAIRLESPKRR